MNTRTLWMGAVVLVLAAGCNRNDATSAGAPDGNRQAGSTITLTGCLQPGEQGLGREPNGASRSSEGVDQFVLANAKTPGSPSASPNDAPAPLYVLDGEEGELRQHVGQQVEVVGKPAEASSDPSQGNARRLDVESVRVIAERCSGI